MAVKLHRCASVWFKLGAHPCWRVQKALDEAGVDYVVVTGPHRRGKRDALRALSGQSAYPVLELEDGTTYRDESARMAARIRAGKLFEEAPGLEPAAGPAGPTSR